MNRVDRAMIYHPGIDPTTFFIVAASVFALLAAQSLRAGMVSLGDSGSRKREGSANRKGLCGSSGF